MGLYDRDYVRDEPRGSFLGGNRSMVTNLILVNVGVFLLDLVFFNRRLSEYLALHADLFTHPWNIWQLLTYGFAHESGQPGTPIVLGNFAHVGFNMFGLWLFGRDVESIYGRKEFLRIYLSLIVLCGLSWVVIQNLMMLSGAWRIPAWSSARRGPCWGSWSCTSRTIRGECSISGASCPCRFGLCVYSICCKTWPAWAGAGRQPGARSL